MSTQQRPRGDAGLVTFIQEKYAQKRYASGVWPPEDSKEDESLPPRHCAPIRTTSKLQIGPRKVADPFPANDLLKFEDEAFVCHVSHFHFHSESNQYVFRMIQPNLRWMELDLPSWLRLWPKKQQKYQDIETRSVSKTMLYLNNDHRFFDCNLNAPCRKKSHNEQHLKLLLLKRIIDLQGKFFVPFVSHLFCRSERPLSGEVIQTTLLDIDDLESVSETMSMASARIIFPPSLHSKSLSSKRPPTPDQARAQRRSNGTPTNRISVAESRQTRPVSTPMPVFDLLDAPLEILPAATVEPIPTKDPFGFMISLEPLVIATGEPITPPMPSPVPKDEMLPLHAHSSVPREEPPSSKKEVASHPLLNQRIGSVLSNSMSNVERKRMEGVPMNEQLPVEPVQLSEQQVQSIREMSRLDQLFVQQIEDFMHFGYRSTVYHKPSYL